MNRISQMATTSGSVATRLAAEMLISEPLNISFIAFLLYIMYLYYEI